MIRSDCETGVFGLWNLVKKANYSDQDQKQFVHVMIEAAAFRYPFLSSQEASSYIGQVHACLLACIGRSVATVHGVKWREKQISYNGITCELEDL